MGVETLFIGWIIIMEMKQVEHNMARRETRDERWQTCWEQEMVNLRLMLYSVYISVGLCSNQSLRNLVDAELHVCCTQCMLYQGYTVLGANWTECMLHSIYGVKILVMQLLHAVLGVYYTWCMLYLVYAVLGVCCTWSMLYLVYDVHEVISWLWHGEIEMDDLIPNFQVQV